MKGRARLGHWQAVLIPVLTGLLVLLAGTAVRATARHSARFGAEVDAVVPTQWDWQQQQQQPMEEEEEDLGLDAMDAAAEGDEQEEAMPTVAMEVGARARRKHFSPPLPQEGMSKIRYFKELRREKISRRMREGGMLRRYAPDLFNADVYGVDDNDNVKVGSRATIWDALNGPFAPPKPQRPPVDAAVVSQLLNLDQKEHERADKRNKIRHLEDAAALAGRDPYAGGYTYLPANHRTKPFGYGRIIARARHWQSLDIGPFERSARTANHAGGNPLSAFSGKGYHDHSPLPFKPHLPFAEADAAFQGMRPSKLQQFPQFVPPPKMPKFAAPPADKAGGDAAPAAGAPAAGGDAAAAPAAAGDT